MIQAQKDLVERAEGYIVFCNEMIARVAEEQPRRLAAETIIWNERIECSLKEIERVKNAEVKKCEDCGEEYLREQGTYSQCRDCREKSFWESHTIVTVNGVDMVATRATEDSPSELL